MCFRSSSIFFTKKILLQLKYFSKTAMETLLNNKTLI